MVGTTHARDEESEEYSAEETAAMGVYGRWRKLVANISVTDEEGDTVGQGSGFVWDGAGHVVTNAHVVGGGDVYTVTFGTSTRQQAQVTARLLGADKLRDVAVLRLDEVPFECPPLRGGAARVGQRVHVLGSPFGLEHSLSVGVVSATGRELTVRRERPPLFDLIQIDAAVNRGCSGGPVLSATGRVLGMTVAIATITGAFAGVGFCVPYETVRLCAEVIIESEGERVPPFATLGVVLAPAATVKSLGVGDGLLVVETREGGPARKAGVRGTERVEGGLVVLGDFIVRIEEVEVRKVIDVWRALRKFQVGDDIEIDVRRQNQGRVTLHVTLMDRQKIGEDAVESGALRRARL